MISKVLLLLAINYSAVYASCVPGTEVGPCDSTCPGTSQCDANRRNCCTLSGNSTLSCIDKINPRTGTSDCPARAHLCDDSVYYSFMTIECPRTCNRCESTSLTTPRTNVCMDLAGPQGVSECNSKAYLCHNSTYKQLMRQQCPKTCGYC